ncbi:MAG: tetratricopeptide repeat protein [Sedimentisphaerales bacterium]|nr:tetratricopeptide repeat protein [Sedimentisphaerales bacterium]
MLQSTGKVNWKLLLVLFIAVIVMVITIFGLRRWHVGGRAEQALATGKEAFNNKQWDLAADQLGRYLTLKPDDAEMLMKYAEAQLNRIPPLPENLIQARNAYRQILRLDDSYSIDSIRREATIAVAQIYIQAGSISDAGEAQLVLERQLQRSPEKELKRLLAAALQKQRKFNEAIAILKSIIAEDKTDIMAYAMLGQLAETRPELFGDPISNADKEGLVLQFLDEAIRENPINVKGFIVRSQYFLRNGHRDRAIEDINTAKTMDMESIMDKLSLAEVMINAALLEDARQQLRLVQQDEPENLVMWRLWAVLVKRVGNRDEMEEVAQQILSLTGRGKILLYSVATELFVLVEDFDSARKCIEDLRREKIVKGQVEFLEGLLAEKQSRNREAIEHWQRALQEGMNTEELHLRLSVAYNSLQDTQSAIGHLRDILSRGESVRASLLLSELLMEIGQFGEAMQQAQAILQRHPDDQRALLILTQARLFVAGMDSSPSKADWDKLLSGIDFLEKEGSDSVTCRLLRIRAFLQRYKVMGNQKDLDEAGLLARELETAFSNDVRAGLAPVEVLMAADRFDEARQQLEILVSRYNDSFAPIQYLVSVYEQLNELHKSPRVIEECLSKMESDSDRRQLALLLAQVYKELDLPDKAFSILDKQIQEWPQDIAILRKAIESARSAGYKDKLQPFIDQIKAIEGDKGWQWRYEQARLWFDSEQFVQRYPEIVDLLKANLLTNPADQLSRTLLAASQAKKGDYHLAVAHYQDALTRDPDNVTLLISTVSALYRAGEIEKADALLENAARRKLYDPELRLSEMQIQGLLMKEQLPAAGQLLEDMLSKMPENDQARLVLARIRIQQKQYDLAMALLDDLAQRKPDSAEVVAARVALYLDRTDTEQALRECNEFIERVGTSEAYMLRARAYLRLDRIDDATRDMQQVRDMETDPIKSVLIETGFYILAGQIDHAIKIIKPAMVKYPEDQRIIRQAAVLLAASPNKNEREEAYDVLKKAIQLIGEDLQLLLLRAQYLLAQKDPQATQQALDDLAELSKKYPKIEQVWTLQAEIYLAEGKRIKALETIHLGLRYLPKSVELTRLKARCEALTSSPEMAVLTLERLAEQNPDRLDVGVNLAEMYVKTGQTIKAIRLLRNMGSQIGNSEKSNERNRIDLALAVTLQSSGNWQEAVGLYRKVLTEQPENIVAINNLAWILCEQENKYSEALQMAQKGLTLSPDYTDLLDTRGVIYYRLRQYPQSAKDLKRCILAYSEQASALTGSYFHLARTESKLGDINSARENLAKALELNKTRGGLSANEVNEASELQEELGIR